MPTRTPGLALLGCVLAARAVVDRIEEDRVIVEWCDRTTSDLPAALFDGGVVEGTVLNVDLRPVTPLGEISPSQSLEPRLAGTDPRGADRPGVAALRQRGQSRTEAAP